MAKTAEQILRDLIAEQIFQIAQLASQVDMLAEQVRKYESETLYDFTHRPRMREQAGPENAK